MTKYGDLAGQAYLSVGNHLSREQCVCSAASGAFNPQDPQFQGSCDRFQGSAIESVTYQASAAAAGALDATDGQPVN